VSPKPAATRRRRLHRRHLRPNQRLWENVPTVCRPWQTTAKGQTLPGYSRTWRNRFPLRRGTQRPNQFLLSLLGHTTCSYGHRPKWRCPAAASRMPQGRSARARQGALGGALEGGRARRRGTDVIVLRPQLTLLGKRGGPGKLTVPENLSGGKPGLRAVSTWAFPVVENGSSLSRRVLFPNNIFKMTTPNKTPPGADPKQLERTGTVREIGSQAVWSLSSCKP
ncbi:hypothetical protein E2I00_002697, partial [Balaenoptera physalus]